MSVMPDGSRHARSAEPLAHRLAQHVAGLPSGANRPVFEPSAYPELASLVQRLQRVMNVAYIPIWLGAPIPALDDKKPLDAIAQGDGRAGARLVSGVEDTGAS